MRQARVTAGLLLVVIATTILATFVGRGSLQSSHDDRLTLNDASILRDEVLGSGAVDESPEEVDQVQSLRIKQKSPNPEQAKVEDDVPGLACKDDKTVSQMVRDTQTREVASVYSLLIAQLSLTQIERQELLALLVDLRIARTFTVCRGGAKLAPQARSEMIAAIIGPAKLEKFLSLERGLPEYDEVAFVDCVLKNNNSLLTEAQKNALLQILIDIAGRKVTLLGADAAPESIEYLEYRLAEMDERERLFFEQAASELSAVQIEHLFEEYQRISYLRREALERQKRNRMDAEEEFLPLYYPARSCSPHE